MSSTTGLVRSGEVISLSGGTTTLEFARRLPDDLEATVIATNPHIAAASTRTLSASPTVAGEMAAGTMELCNMPSRWTFSAGS